MFDDTLVEEDIHPAYVSAGITETGRVRASNQDAFIDQPKEGLWAVADGMGGHRDGDVASRMVCEGMQSFEPAGSLEDCVDELRQRMSQVNAALYAAAIRPIDPVQSGSTVVMFVARRTSCAVLWAGDSRAYRLRDRKLVQMTTDHTWASELQLDEDSAEESDHAITRAVGGDEVLLLDVRRDRVRLGDRYLLCSDGLTRELTTSTIASLLAQGDVKQASKALIDATLANGARDNVTVVVVDAT
ncbi:MAG TPA: PP2C family serine/threonine-protein phosphatase [Steroidobacteraceae bacterium]|nr:PP2C family serine/threonine-protein phosphatase [Steroidobacteraceae bacterium]